MNSLGLIHIYTGDGKGKSTAAAGLAVRALGRGMKVCFCSFHKHPEKYGYTEMESLKKLGATVLNFAQEHPHLDKSIDENRIREAVPEALRAVSQRLKTEPFDLMVLDEILISVRDGYLDETLLLDFMDGKPENTELVLTGRCATPKVMECAHYVTFCKKMKHPYDRGLLSRAGIEY